MAAFLPHSGRSVLIEAEAAPGYHTTGRSAAIYSKVYGNALIRALSAASEDFFQSPPVGFSDHPLLTRRGTLFLADETQGGSLDKLEVEAAAAGAETTRLSATEAVQRVSILKPQSISQALWEPGAMDMDVEAIHRGFLKMAKARGVATLCNARVTDLRRRSGGAGWVVTAGDDVFEADILVNASGAWGDVLAKAAGVRPMNLNPLRRTAMIVAPPECTDVSKWPLVLDVDEQFYFKPEAGKLLLSPADETPSFPCDAFPEEIDVAIGVDRIQQVADLPVRRIEHQWAGLRTFAPDRSPVVGFDRNAPDFFWLVGQGGYGIQTAAALGRVAAALAARKPIPAEIADFGVSEAALDPDRFRLSASRFSGSGAQDVSVAR